MSVTVQVLRQELLRLRQELALRPIRVPTRGGGGAVATVNPYWVIIAVKGGNILPVSSLPGIKRVETETLADPWVYFSSQATATATVLAGVVTALTLVSKGLAYPSTPAPLVTFSGGGGSAAAATAEVTDFNYVLGCKITACGAGYVTTPIITFSAPPAGGTLATGTVELRNGKVVFIRITNPGSGYDALPTITFDSGAATAVPIMAKGSILKLNITNGGTGYTTAPAVNIAAPAVDPLHPSAPDDLPDGLGWGQVVYTLPGAAVSAGSRVALVNDPRSTIPHALVGPGDSPTTTVPSDSIMTWGTTTVRINGADPDADGVMPAWIPMGGGG